MSLTMAKKKIGETVRIFVELDADLARLIHELANRNHRTLKGELTLAIQKHLDEHGMLKPKRRD